MIYALLKEEAKVQVHCPRGQVPLEPILYDPELHHRHRNGEYHPIKNAPVYWNELRLPKQFTQTENT